MLAKQAFLSFPFFFFLLLIQILVAGENLCLLGYLTMEISAKEVLEFAAEDSGLSHVPLLGCIGHLHVVMVAWQGGDTCAEAQ